MKSTILFLIFIMLLHAEGVMIKK